VTATGVLDEELTPLDGCSEPEELVPEELVPVDDDVAEEPVEELVEELAVEFDACEVEVEVPGIVAALTAANTPTPASAPAAAPKVRRWSNRRPASRERTLAWVGFVISMAPSLPDGAKSYLRAG